MLQKITFSTLLTLLLVIVTAGLVMAYNESPQLAELVKKGELPPVDERLPEEPVIVQPEEMVGDYGGTWNVFIDGAHRTSNMTEWTHIGLLRWNREQSGPALDLAKGYDVSEDGKVFTFYLRKGLKWSDGEPLTSEDFEFWFEDMVKNDELYPSKPTWMKSVDGKICEFVKVDNYTFQYQFSQPNGLFIWNVTKNRDEVLLAPKHYLKQFHPKYANEEELNKKMTEEGFDSWYALFGFKNDADDLHNPELPTMQPWVPTVEPPTETFVFKRNPYFYKVDTEGNQLPYIDEVRMQVVDPEVMIMKTIAGQADFQPSRLITFSHYPLLKENEEAGGYELLYWDDLQMSETTIQLNLNTKDPVLNELFNKKEFHQAISLALDRDRMSEMLFAGVAEPVQASLSPISPFYNEKYLTAYIEHDVERANKLLNSIGTINERDNEGYRLRPDGKRLHFTIELPSARIAMVDILELAKEDLKDVGIEVTIKPIHPSLFSLKQQTDEGQAYAWNMGKSFMDTDLVPRDLADCRWAPLYGLWYASGGEKTTEVRATIEGEQVVKKVKGVEPPPEIKKNQNIWAQILVTVDQEKQAALYDQLLASQAENLWIIGTVGLLGKPMAKKTYFHNVPEKGTWSFHHGHFIGWSEPYQYFIEKGAQK